MKVIELLTYCIFDAFDIYIIYWYNFWVLILYRKL